MEIHIFDMIQNLRTPIEMYCSAHYQTWRCGNHMDHSDGIITDHSEDKKDRVIMMAALLVDVLLCNVPIKNLVARTRPSDVNTAVIHWSQSRRIHLPVRTHGGFHLLRLRHCILLPERRRCGKRPCTLRSLIALSRLYLYAFHPTDYYWRRDIRKSSSDIGI